MRKLTVLFIAVLSYITLSGQNEHPTGLKYEWGAYGTTGRVFSKTGWALTSHYYVGKTKYWGFGFSYDYFKGTVYDNDDALKDYATYKASALMFGAMSEKDIGNNFFWGAGLYLGPSFNNLDDLKIYYVGAGSTITRYEKSMGFRFRYDLFLGFKITQQFGLLSSLSFGYNYSKTEGITSLYDDNNALVLEDNPHDLDMTYWLYNAKLGLYINF